MFDVLDRLSMSRFRSSFRLKEKDICYIEEKGLETIKNHAFDFINKRLKPKVIINDGKQTPMKGHPVFIAQHATATCCRSCLYKWHKIKQNKELDEREVEYVVEILMTWIINQYKKSRKM